MAPLTRSRAIDNVPNDLMATYYQQRAEAGLIITEGTSPSPNGLGYARIPGLFDAAQVEGWKKTTSAVHAAGSRIFVQLMHCGRVGHALNLPAGARVLGPSAIATPGEMYTDAQGQQPFQTPTAMTEEDIEQAIEEYVHSSALAIEAGFDGVELHSANGYLLEQFLNVASNQRTDRWGGSVENRARFVLEVARRVTAKIGKERTGMRLSPYGAFNGTVADEHTDELYTHLARELNTIGLVYLHIVDHSSMGAPPVKPELKKVIRDSFHGAYILSGGYDLARAEADLAEKKGDLVAFGRAFLANPRLVSKLKSGAALTPPDFSTFYTPGEKGYTDYPTDG
jgi:N-ethylmaleimide reductase